MEEEKFLFDELEEILINIAVKYVGKFHVPCEKCLPPETIVNLEEYHSKDIQDFCKMRTDDCECIPRYPSDDDPMSKPDYIDIYFKKLYSTRFIDIVIARIENLNEFERNDYLLGSLEQSSRYEFLMRNQWWQAEIRRRLNVERWSFFQMWLAFRVMDSFNNYHERYITQIRNIYIALLNHTDFGFSSDSERKAIKEILKNFMKRDLPDGFSFGCRIERKDLDSFVKYLNLRLTTGFITLDKSNASDFYDLLTKEITFDTKAVYFICETAQLTFILEQLKKFVPRLTRKNIELSGLFYTTTKVPLKADNIARSLNGILGINGYEPKHLKEIQDAFSFLSSPE